MQAAGQDAPAAQKSVVLDSLAKGDMVAAEAACRALLDAPTPHALHELVEEAQALDELPEVRQLYQNMIAARPDDPQVIWLKTGVAIANVHLADDTAVEAMLQNIAAGHGSDDRMAEAFGQIAWAYRKGQQYDKALSINQYTVDHWPQKDRAAYAQQGIVLCQIALGDLAAADEALNVLIQKFGTDADASKLVLWSAFGYQDGGQKDRAYEVYERVVQYYPGTPEAITAQVRRAVASVEAEDVNRMEQDIGTFLTQLAPTPDNGEGLSYLANGLFWKHMTLAGKQEDLIAAIDGHLETIANTTLAAWPKSDWALTAQRDLAVVAIQRGDDSPADAVVQKMLTDYAGHPRLIECVRIVAECYRDRAQVEQRRISTAQGPEYGWQRGGASPEESVINHYRKVLETCELIIQNLPEDSTNTPTAYYYAGECYMALGQSGTAIDYYQKVCDTWPDYRLSWHLQYLIGRKWQAMKRDGRMSAQEADRLTKSAYERLVRDYPNCAPALSAANWLKTYAEKMEGDHQ